MKDLKTNIELSFKTNGRQDLSATARTVTSIKDALTRINSLKTGLSGAGRSIDSVTKKLETHTNKMEGLTAQVKLASAAMANFTGRQNALSGILKQNAVALQAQVAAMREVAKLNTQVGGTSRAGVGGRPAGSTTVDPGIKAAKEAAAATRLAQREAAQAAAESARQARLALATRIADENKAHKQKLAQIQEQNVAIKQQSLELQKQNAAATAAARADAAVRRQQRNADRLARAAERASRVPATPGRMQRFRATAERRFGNSVSGLANSGGAGGLLTTAAVTAGGLGIFNAMKEMDGLRKQLEAVSGSTDKANDRLKFLNDTADQLGANTKSLIGTFTGFSVAGEAAGLVEEDIRKITKSITQANTVMNAANPETLKRGMIALQQMLGKGTVQMEELKGQFGDAFKDAIPMAARAAGVSVDQLMKQIEDGSVRSAEFVKLFALEYEKQYAGAAKKAASSIQAQQNRIANSFNELIDELNRSGAADGIAEGFREVNKAIRDAFDPKTTKELAVAMGTLAKEIGSAIASIIKFVSENPEIASMAAKVLAVVAAMASLKFVVSTILGPVATLFTAFGGASLAAGLFKKLATAIGSVGAAATVAAGSVARLVGLVGAATAGVAAVAYAGVGVAKAKGASDALSDLKGKGWAGLNEQEAQQKLQALEESKGNLFGRAARGVASVFSRNNSGATLEQEIELGKGRLEALRVKRLADASTQRRKAAEAEAGKAAGSVAGIEAEQAALRQNLFKNTGAGAGGGSGGSNGRSASAQANEMRSAARAAAKITTQAELEVIKAARERKIAELDRELEAGKVSYARYFGEIKQARLAEIEEEKAAVLDRIDEEIAAENVAMADAIDAASKKAIQVRIDALEQSKISKEMAFQERSSTVLAETEEKRSQAVKDLAKEYASLAAELDSFDGVVNLDNFRAGLEAQYAKVRDSFIANNNQAGVAVVDSIINNKVAKERLGNVNTTIGNRELEVQNQIAELELKVLERKSTSFDIENQTLELKKQLAEQTIATLEAELAITEDAKTRLELNSRIIEQKKVLAEKTADQKAAEESVSGALEKMFGDAQTLTFSLKELIGNFVKDIANDMQRQLSKKLAEMAMGQIFGGGGQSGGGGGSILGSILGTFGQIVTGSFTGGGGGLGNVFSGSGMPSVSGSGISSALGSGIRPSSSGLGTVVNMVVNTPDANSFRASQTQLNQQLFSAGQRAAQRS